ncbi:MAG: hypothetical protein AAGF12_02620 [Myxococcota bacterium]
MRIWVVEHDPLRRAVVRVSPPNAEPRTTQLPLPLYRIDPRVFAVHTAEAAFPTPAPRVRRSDPPRERAPSRDGPAEPPADRLRLDGDGLASAFPTTYLSVAFRALAMNEQLVLGASVGMGSRLTSWLRIEGDVGGGVTLDGETNLTLGLGLAPGLAVSDRWRVEVSVHFRIQWWFDESEQSTSDSLLGVDVGLGVAYRLSPRNSLFLRASWAPLYNSATGQVETWFGLSAGFRFELR